MKFKSSASPAPYPGKKKFGKKLTAPDQSMSLKEILTRFTRNEALPIGKDVEYGDEGDEDLEKISGMDLTEQAEIIEKQKAIRERFVKQEKDRIKQLEKEEREKIAEKVQKEKVFAKGEKLHKVHPSKSHRKDIDD